jgi:hypothetical protein
MLTNGEFFENIRQVNADVSVSALNDNSSAVVNKFVEGFPSGFDVIPSDLATIANSLALIEKHSTDSSLLYIIRNRAALILDWWFL